MVCWKTFSRKSMIMIGLSVLVFTYEFGLTHSHKWNKRFFSDQQWFFLFQVVSVREFLLFTFYDMMAPLKCFSTKRLYYTAVYQQSKNGKKIVLKIVWATVATYQVIHFGTAQLKETFIQTYLWCNILSFKKLSAYCVEQEDPVNHIRDRVRLKEDGRSRHKNNHCCQLP